MQLILFFILLSKIGLGADVSHEEPEKEEIQLRAGKKKKTYGRVVVQRLSRAFTNPDATKRKFSAPHLGSSDRVQVLRSSTDERRPKSTIPLAPMSIAKPLAREKPRTVKDYYKDQLNYLEGFEKKNLSHSTFLFCNCSEVSFIGSNLSYSVFNHAVLLNTNFSKANLTEASFIGARLIDACLAKTDLTNADLSKALLMGASLLNANLTGAILDGACFEGADLRNAHIRGPHGTIRLIDKNYLDGKKAKYDENTKFGLKTN